MDDPNFPLKKQKEFMWLSTYYFVITALIIRFLTGLQIALLLKFYRIYFTYSPFGVMLEKGGRGNWEDSKIILVFGLGPFLATAIGLIMVRSLKKSRSMNWKTRLFFTWFAFLLVHQLPFNMLAGAFFYDGFGYAFTNMILWKYARILLALFAVGISIYFRAEWLALFLKTAPSHRFIVYMQRYLRRIFTYPWLIGTGILALFAMASQSFIWVLTSLALGLVVLPILNRASPSKKVRLSKADSRDLYKSQHVVLMQLFFLALLLLASFYQIRL